MKAVGDRFPVSGSSVTLSPRTRLLHLPLDFELQHGGRLPAPRLAYERTGPAGAPVVVVLGGISAGRDPTTWWRGFAGKGAPIDPARHAVLGIDWLGGAGESTGPEPNDRDFPFVSTLDQARAIALLLDHLGVETVDAWIGASYGGMVGLAFAAHHPGRLRRLLALGAADRSHPMVSALRAVQRRIVRLGIEAGRGAEAVAIARGLAMASYRSAEEFAARFDGGPEWRGQRPRFAVEDYLEARGSSFAERFSPPAFLCLNESIDAHSVEPERVAVETLLVSFSSDQLVPPAQIGELAARLPRLRRHVVIETPYGHDGFLKEKAALAPLVAEVLP